MSDVLLKRSNQTEKEALKLLEEYNRCAILRPTGFGKTVIMCRVASNSKYKSVLYVYPSDIIKKSAIKWLTSFNAIEKVKFISYHAIGRMNKNPELLFDKVRGNFDLVIFDELHHMGAELRVPVLDYLFTNLSNVHMIGATATPKRMDGFDVVSHYFEDKVVTYYGLESAIHDKIMPKPYYVYAADTYENEIADIKSRCSDIPKKMLSGINTDIRKAVKKLDKLTNAPEIIHSCMLKIYKKKLPNYMRFMVFFPNKADLEIRKNEIIGWFQSEFTEYDVDHVVIHSSATERKNLDELEFREARDKTIDLIMSIDMLNEGYHIDSVTGVVLLRPTKSATVYTQQVGRCLQVNAKHRPIIFDFVSNIKIKSIFNASSTSVVDYTNNDMPAAWQEENLNNISYNSVVMVDYVADVQNILNKVQQSIPDSKEVQIIKDRIGKFALPASALANKHRLSVWEVCVVLDKYNHILEPLGLQKQEADYWSKGCTNNTFRVV